MTDTPRDPQPLTAEQLAQVRAMLTAPADTTGLSEPAANTIRLLLGAGRRLLATLDARSSGDEALREALATIEAMSGDAADLHDLIGEAAAMRTVLSHLLNPKGRIHDSGCGTCDAGRALLSADHELPSSALATPVSPSPEDERREAIADDRAWASGYAAGRAAALRESGS